MKNELTRQEFVSRRRSGIGGSDIGAICGVSAWKSPLDVYFDKVNPPAPEADERFPIGETKSLYWGAVHEAAIAEAFTIVTGIKLMRYNRQIVDPEIPYFIANVDRLAYCVDGSRPFNAKTGEIFTDTGVEIKTCRWKDDDWGDEGTDEVPAQYFLQCQWYMSLIPSIKKFYLVVLFGGNDMKIYLINRDNEIIGKIREIGNEFWVGNVQAQNPPPPRSIEEVKALFPNSQLEKKTADNDLERNLYRLAELTAARKEAEKAEDDLKFIVAQAMADCDIAVDADGKIIATFKQNKKGNRLLSVKVN